MVTNFDYLKKEPKFSAFADVAVSAEKIILLDPEASILNSRRAMEFAVKWMYSVDNALEMPYQDNLQSLMNSEDYRQSARICGSGWTIFGGAEIMRHTAAENWDGMKRCFAWKIFLFISIILHTAIPISISGESSTKH